MYFSTPTPTTSKLSENNESNSSKSRQPQTSSRSSSAFSNSTLSFSPSPQEWSPSPWASEKSLAYSKSPSAPSLSSVPLPDDPYLSNAPSLSSISLPSVSPRLESAWPSPSLNYAPSMPSVPLPPSSFSSSAQFPPSIHPIISYDPAGRLYFNVSLPPASIRFRGNSNPMAEFATAQAETYLRLRIAVPPFKWIVEVMNPGGVTIGGVLAQLSRAMQTPLDRNEATVLSEYLRRQVWQAGTLRRVDCLGKNVFFVGLRPAGGVWDVQFASRIVIAPLNAVGPSFSFAVVLLMLCFPNFCCVAVYFYPIYQRLL